MTNVLYKKNKDLNADILVRQDVNTNNSPLEYTQIKVLEMKEGATFEETLEAWEACVVAQLGKVSVYAGEDSFENIGRREHVFEKNGTDSVYINDHQAFKVKAETDARIVIAYAPSDNKLPNRLIPAEDVPAEHRGKYSNKRTAFTILGDDDDLANSLLVVEVYTDSGNWSSYPPHKHDQDNLPEESFLEEIYYHEMDPEQGFVFQRIYTDDRSLDELNAVEHQDCVIVPAGYHPVAVPDGYDSYYLNVMAGPTRSWNFYNEPDHEWILNRD